MYKRHRDHAAEVLCRLLEAREDAACFFEPTDQPFDDVPPPVGIAVELDRAGITVFILLGWNHRLDAQFDQVLVNPIGPVSLVAGQRHGPGDGPAGAVKQIGIRFFEQGRKDRRLVRLSCAEMEVQGMAFSITQDMDLCRKTSARAA